MRQQRLIGGIVLIAGVVLLVLGLRDTDSFASRLERIFRDTPTDWAIWMTIGGAVLILAGGAAALSPCRGGKCFGR
ncbi:MAG: DUF3185 family protein [Planctomycetota bacterium]